MACGTILGEGGARIACGANFAPILEGGPINKVGGVGPFIKVITVLLLLIDPKIGFIGYWVGTENPMRWNWAGHTQCIGWAPKTQYPKPTMRLPQKMRTGALTEPKDSPNRTEHWRNSKIAVPNRTEPNKRTVAPNRTFRRTEHCDKRPNRTMLRSIARPTEPNRSFGSVRFGSAKPKVRSGSSSTPPPSPVRKSDMPFIVPRHLQKNAAWAFRVRA